MIIERKNGGYLISAFVGGYLVQRFYIYYTRKEAIKLFTAAFKNGGK